MFRRCLLSLLVIVLVASLIPPQTALAKVVPLQWKHSSQPWHNVGGLSEENPYYFPDPAKNEKSQLAELIEQETKEKILVRVHDQQYSIVSLKREIGTATLEPRFGLALAREVKVYIDDSGNPVPTSAEVWSPRG